MRRILNFLLAAKKVEKQKMFAKIVIEMLFRLITHV